MEKQYGPLYILDLEGTLGIFSHGTNHVNDTIQLRPGAIELIESANKQKTRVAIATRAPKYFVDEIRENLKKTGIEFNFKVYTKEDIQLPSSRFINYKDFRQIYKDHDIKNPAKDVAVIGDFLRFPDRKGFSKDDFLKFDFNKNPEVLYTNNSLNDHPLPTLPEPPIYTVLAQLWTTIERKERQGLDLMCPIKFLNSMYYSSVGNFKKGLKNLQSEGDSQFQYIKTDGLAKNKFGRSIPQDYLVIKGHQDFWKPLINLM